MSYDIRLQCSTFQDGEDGKRILEAIFGEDRVSYAGEVLGSKDYLLDIAKSSRYWIDMMIQTLEGTPTDPFAVPPKPIDPPLEKPADPPLEVKEDDIPF